MKLSHLEMLEKVLSELQRRQESKRGFPNDFSAPSFYWNGGNYGIDTSIPGGGGGKHRYYPRRNHRSRLQTPISAHSKKRGSGRGRMALE